MGEDLSPKIQVIRQLAKEFANYYVALDGIFAKTEVEKYDCKVLAEDGVHPSLIGHNVIADEILKMMIDS